MHDNLSVNIYGKVLPLEPYFTEL